MARSRASARIVIDRDEITPRLQAMPDKLDLALRAVMAFEAGRAQNIMRSDAPWTDQTGNARNGLFAQPFSDGNESGIELFHSVPYGIWLETRWSGRYAIIEPTVSKHGPEVMRTVSEVFRRL